MFENSTEVPFQPEYFVPMGDRLYVLGYNKKGFAVIDISEMDNIRPLGFYNHPHKGHIARLNIAPSKSGDFVIMVNPEDGVFKINTQNPGGMYVVDYYPLYTAHRVLLSADEKSAFVMTYNGIVSLDVSGNVIKKLDEFSAKVDLSQDSYVDKENFHDHLMINLTFVANGDLKFINENEILFITYGGAYIFDVSNPAKIKLVKHKQSTSSPWRIQISSDGKKAYYAELHKFVIFDIDKFQIEKTIGDDRQWYFLYQDFGVLESFPYFYLALD